ncbi:MAG: hypothetical protein ACRBCK_00920 [Alphaproteobacteria bacterium]
MSNFLASFLLTCLVLVGFVSGLRYCSLQDQNIDSFGVKMVNRQRAKIPVRQQDIDSGFPLATEVRLIYETDDKLVCEIDYYVRAEDTFRYGMSLSPNRANYYNEKNSLKRGRHTQKITIYFSPKSSMKRNDQTSSLSLQIHEKVDGNYMGVVYKRKIILDKVWKKVREYRPYLNPAEAKTN